MGIFVRKNEANGVRKITFGLYGYVLKADEKYISYQSMYGKSFRVLKSDIESVSLDQGGAGKNIVKLNGKGTMLASLELPRTWAEQAQEFIQEEIS